MYLFCY